MPDAYSLFDLVQAQNYLSIDVHNGQVCSIMFFLPSVFLQYWRNDHKNARPLFCDVQPSSLITSTKKFFVVWLVNTGIRTGAYYRDRTDYRLAGTSDYERDVVRSGAQSLQSPECCTAAAMHYWHCPHSMRSKVYETVRCPSLRSSMGLL